MKFVLPIFLFVFSLTCFSQSLSIPNPGSNQERLEDIDDEVRRIRRNQLLDEMRRDQQFRNNGPVDYLIVRGFNKIYQNSEMSVYIQDRTISKQGENVSYAFLYMFSKPRFVDKITYFNGEGFGYIDCKKSIINISFLVGLDKNFNGLVEFQRGTMETKNEPEKTIKSYLCR